jgi:hypothetical protein
MDIFDSLGRILVQEIENLYVFTPSSFNEFTSSCKFRIVNLITMESEIGIVVFNLYD